MDVFKWCGHRIITVCFSILYFMFLVCVFADHMSSVSMSKMKERVGVQHSAWIELNEAKHPLKLYLIIITGPCSPDVVKSISGPCTLRCIIMVVITGKESHREVIFTVSNSLVSLSFALLCIPCLHLLYLSAARRSVLLAPLDRAACVHVYACTYVCKLICDQGRGP